MLQYLSVSRLRDVGKVRELRTWGPLTQQGAAPGLPWPPGHCMSHLSANQRPGIRGLTNQKRRIKSQNIIIRTPNNKLGPSPIRQTRKRKKTEDHKYLSFERLQNIVQTNFVFINLCMWISCSVWSDNQSVQTKMNESLFLTNYCWLERNICSGVGSGNYQGEWLLQGLLKWA